MTHPADIKDIERQAAILVGKAEALGVTLRINVEPVQPLAMGNTRHTIEAWAARNYYPVPDGARSLGAVQLDVFGAPKVEMTLIERKAVEVLNSLKAAVDGGLIILPEEMQMDIDVVLMTVTQRRAGVA